jgi:hypothetical protein
MRRLSSSIPARGGAIGRVLERIEHPLGEVRPGEMPRARRGELRQSRSVRLVFERPCRPEAMLATS